MTIKELEMMLQKIKNSGADENLPIKVFLRDSDRLTDFAITPVDAYVDEKDKWSEYKEDMPCVIFLGIKM